MQAAWNSSERQAEPSLRLRRGFTLLELMIVVVIIAILIGLLLPAIMGVRRTARDAEVRNDISKLEQAITQFKVTYGVEPPSLITIYPPYSSPATNPWDADPKSKGIIRQIWPKFNFQTCGGMGASYPGSNPLRLTGSECLVFFLGGMFDASGSLIGFSKDPTSPFVASSGSGSRDGPFFEFVGAKSGASFTGRLMDFDGDGLPEYKDPLPQQTMPYAYFHSNDAGRYSFAALPAPFTTISTTKAGASWCNLDGLGYSWNSGTSQFVHNLSYDLLQNAYYQSWTAAGGATGASASSPYKAKGFQIISPGADATFGAGGLFNPDSTTSLSTYDRDNITNFHPGRLAN